MKLDVSSVFEEKAMLLLSLATLPGAIVQLLTRLDQEQSLVVDAVDWFAVSFFVAEYAIKLYSAPSKVRFVENPWTVLDLGIILLAFGGLVVSLPILYSAPVLRTFRGAKIFAESGRSSAELSR